MLRKAVATVTKNRYFYDFKRSRDLKKSFFDHWMCLFKQKQAFDRLITFRASALKTKVLLTLRNAVVTQRRRAEKHKLITAYFIRRFLKRIFVRWLPAAKQANASDFTKRTLKTFFVHWRREFQLRVATRQQHESQQEQLARA